MEQYSDIKNNFTDSYQNLRIRSEDSENTAN